MDKLEYIFVGSTNPVKINAVTQATAEKFPSIQVTSVDVPTGIAEQPMTDEETRNGARNRAMAAYEDGCAQVDFHPSADFSDCQVIAVGLEGGVFEREDGELWSTVWAAVYDGEEFYESNGARFKVPDIIAEAIKKGGEMGPIMDDLMGGQDVRRKQGAIGVITNNFIDRTEEYSIIAKMALGVWFGREWQQQLSAQTSH